MDSNIVTILVAMLINVPTLYLMFEEKRKRKSETEQNKQQVDKGNVETALELRSEMKADREEYRRENIALHEELESLQKDLNDEREARRILEIQFAKSTQRIAELEANNSRLQLELQNERAARGLMETNLIEASQRISALEDELDRRNRRIAELEGNSG